MGQSMIYTTTAEARMANGGEVGNPMLMQRSPGGRVDYLFIQRLRPGFGETHHDAQ
jgi:hypothetical protein